MFRIQRAAAAMMASAVLCGCDRSNAPAAKSQAEPPLSVPAENVEKSLAAAQTYLDTRDVEKAFAILNLLIDRAPNEARAHELMGQTFALQVMVARERGDKVDFAELQRKAYEHYKKAVTISPNSAGLQHSAGQMAMAAGDIDAALEHFRSAGRIDPTNPQYPLFEAQILIPRKDFGAAKSALQRVLGLDPDEPFALASLAMIAVEENDFDAALSHMKRAREQQPDDLGLRAQEAKIHRKRGDANRALELLIGLSDADRAKQFVAIEIALSYEHLGQPLNAAKAWQHVYQIDQVAPMAWLAAVHVSEYLLKAGDREQAYLWYQQARLAAPSAPQVVALEKALASHGDSN